MRIEEVERERGRRSLVQGTGEKGQREAKKREMGEDKGSRFNRWYKEVNGEGIPGYLKK